ncbi:MAG: 2-oxoacid:acceptor oxidoreductase family protein [Desulfurococcaceae archaeon]
MLIEIRWHSRGGQGGWTASNLTSMAASYEGKYVQSFPAFGPERSGAPILSFTRISDEPIDIHSMIYEPDIVVVLDYTLLSPNIISGLKPGGAIITNYTGDVKLAVERLGVKPGEYRLILVPASKLAMEILKAKITNTAMLAGLVKQGVVGINSVERAIRDRFSGQLAERNISLVKRSLDESVEV